MKTNSERAARYRELLENIDSTRLAWVMACADLYMAEDSRKDSLAQLEKETRIAMESAKQDYQYFLIEDRKQNQNQ